MWVDTHCHLDAAEFDADRDTVADAAFACGVTTIVVPAVERANFGAVASVCRDYSGCHAAYGIHPMYVARAHDDDLIALSDMLSGERVVALGEIGLDRFVEQRDEARQAHFFSAQLRLARDLQLPVLLHVRRAIDEVLKHLRAIRVCGGIAHAFNGSRQQADEFIRLGFKLGFGGAASFPRARRIRELAAILPIDSIVLETDAPDMAPEWIGGGRNEPRHLPRIAQVIADLRGVPVEALALATRANVASVLPALRLQNAPTRLH